jgi:group II intron reverse transcriptase/maturase
MLIERHKLTTARPNRDAIRWGGAARSRVEAFVMKVEQRGSIRIDNFYNNRKGWAVRDMSRTINIPKEAVFLSWKMVKANRGSYGIDRQSIKDFESDLSPHLYRIWNRLCSGSYFPPGVKGVDIPKRSGTRRLGVPTVADRVAQGTIKVMFENRLESVFDEDSYGYRPGRSCHDAVAVTRRRCWQYSWVVEYDIRGLFDNISHDLLMKAVCLHFPEKWVKMYIERWLKAPMVNPDGTVSDRVSGTPQGGVLSPLLSNLFMHYATDLWMRREFPDLPWCRYADDGLVHCLSEKQAKMVRDKLERRLQGVGLELHPEKTCIVYCRDDRRRRSTNWPVTSFEFLGFEFTERSAQKRTTGDLFRRFLPAIGRNRLKELRHKLKKQPVLRAMYASIDDLARALNPIIRGWFNYYGKFYPAKLKSLNCYINERLMIWLKDKYRRSRKGGTKARSYRFLRRIQETRPTLFYHWKHGLSTF